MKERKKQLVGYVSVKSEIEIMNITQLPELLQ